MKPVAIAAFFALIAGPALAHTGFGTTADFTSGFLHPVAGLDHVLAMVAVGLLAALIGARALWAVPLSFVIMMIVGGALGYFGVTVPAVELGITMSIIIIGAAVACGKPWPVAAVAALAGSFAIFHGYAHGAEMPMEAGAGLYTLGFAAGTTLLHLVGIATGLTAFRHRSLIRAAGAAMCATGLVLLAV
jgi:urease accessory protein